MARRLEGIVALVLWAIACTWTIAVCWRLGYQAQAVETLGGIPRWIVLGIFVPWGVMFLAHTLYSLFLLGRGAADDS